MVDVWLYMFQDHCCQYKFNYYIIQHVLAISLYFQDDQKMGHFGLISLTHGVAIDRDYLIVLLIEDRWCHHGAPLSNFAMH